MTLENEKVKLLSFADAGELAKAAASAFLDEIEAAPGAGKPCCIALSGGRIAKTFFDSVVEQARNRAVSFGNVHFFWADERCVPPDDPESNFKMAVELLFKPLKIPENQVHRIRGEEPQDIAVAKAEFELRQMGLPEEGGLPILDLIILGMGEDGHVASLFPGAPPEVVNCAAPFLAIENSSKPPPRRISLSYGAIAAARNVWVLISGSGKETALRESLSSSGTTPLAKVIQSRQKTWIFSQIETGKKI